MKMVDFAQYVKENITNHLSEDMEIAEIELKTVQKANGIVLTGISVRKKEETIAPTLYLEKYLAEYESGEDLPRILDEIGMSIEAAMKPEFTVENIDDWEWVKTRIIPVLINNAKSSKYIEDLVHDNFAGDVDIIYKIVVASTDDGTKGIISIPRKLFETWNVSEDVLRFYAEENIMNLLTPDMKGIEQVISEIAGKDLTEGLHNEMTPIVVTSKEKTLAASVILYKGVQKDLERALGKRFYIIPSSIHELLVLKADEGQEEDIKAMIREVNSTVVSAEDYLSDTLFIYDNGEIKEA